MSCLSEICVAGWSATAKESQKVSFHLTLENGIFSVCQEQ